MTYDVLISHADEDSDFAIQLANKLKELDITVFLDKFELKAGDSLSSTINRAVLSSRFAVVIASPKYFEKKWTMRELGAVLAREDTGKMTILPLLYELDHEQLKDLFPILSDKFTLSSSDGIDSVASSISIAVNANAASVAANAAPVSTPAEAQAGDSAYMPLKSHSSILKLWRPYIRGLTAQWQYASMAVAA